MPCASPGSSRTRRPDLDDLLLALRVVVSLAAVLGVLWLLQRRLSRRAAGRERAETIRVVAKQGLGAKANLVVVEVDGTRYILAVTERGVSVVDQLTVPTALEPAPEPLRELGFPGDQLAAPLPLRRTRHTATAARSVGPPAPATRAAAQALRRAIGA